MADEFAMPKRIAQGLVEAAIKAAVKREASQDTTSINELLRRTAQQLARACRGVEDGAFVRVETRAVENAAALCDPENDDVEKADALLSNSAPGWGE